MILLNETFREEIKNRLQKGEKIRTCFHEIITLQKDRENLSLELTNKMETLAFIYLQTTCFCVLCWVAVKVFIYL